MLNRTPFKFLLVALVTLLISACSSTPEKAADSSASPTIENSSSHPYRSDYRQPHGKIPALLSRSNVSKLKMPAENITDVWQRIREGLEISDYEQLDPETERHLRWFVSHQPYIGRVVERARPYLYYIVNEVEKRGMPMEAALLPIVESGFKPNAYSRSHASGLWQFIPGTGEVFGLEQNWWYDGRRDVIESTRAALDYLQKLHNDFGDWQLAFAAYNCGEGTVGRAIKHNQKRGKPTDFWSLDLPTETSAYVPKLMAVSHLVKFPEKYDLALSPIANEPYLDIIEIGSQIDLAKAAKMAGISMDEMHHLNPAFNRWATAPKGPHRLLLPLSKSKQFETALAAIPPNKRVQWARHQVRHGESLSVIARRYDTNISIIRQANDLHGNQIRAGSHLLIPMASASVSRFAANATPKASEQNKSFYTVKPGDTWWRIAKTHQISIAALTQWNKKTSAAVLKPGQKLVLLSSPASQSRKSISYTIRNGDSLWAISRKFNVSINQVREWNGLNIRSMLLPGQNLTLYLDET